MDDLERQITEIRTTVLNLCTNELESRKQDTQLIKEIEEIKKRLTDIEDFLGNQNGRGKLKTD